MKTIQTRLRNRLTETNLGNLMETAIEGLDELSDSDLEQQWTYGGQSKQDLYVFNCLVKKKKIGGGGGGTEPLGGKHTLLASMLITPGHLPEAARWRHVSL